jgi:hypothetical protein
MGKSWNGFKTLAVGLSLDHYSGVVARAFTNCSAGWSTYNRDLVEVHSYKGKHVQFPVYRDLVAVAFPAVKPSRSENTRASFANPVRISCITM